MKDRSHKPYARWGRGGAPAISAPALKALAPHETWWYPSDDLGMRYSDATRARKRRDRIARAEASATA